MCNHLNKESNWFKKIICALIDIKNRNVVRLAYFFMLLFLALFVIEMCIWSIPNIYYASDKSHKIANFYNISIVLLTAVIVFVGWVQLRILSNTAKSEFLLNIDNRFGSLEIIQARSIIQKYYCETRNEKKSDDHHFELIQNKIHNTCMDADRSEQAMYLLNFMDFLETISFFEDTNKISFDEINNLSGDTIYYYYRVYTGWINARRKKGNQDAYKALEKLANKINKSNGDSNEKEAS